MTHTLKETKEKHERFISSMGTNKELYLFMRFNQLAETCAELNSDELEIVLLVAKGLADGQKVYGPLNVATDKRDMKQEATEELRDCLVYVNAALLKLLSAKDD